jgi:hypothetical protein
VQIGKSIPELDCYNKKYGMAVGRDGSGASPQKTNRWLAKNGLCMSLESIDQTVSHRQLTDRAGQRLVFLKAGRSSGCLNGSVQMGTQAALGSAPTRFIAKLDCGAVSQLWRKETWTEGTLPELFSLTAPTLGLRPSVADVPSGGLALNPGPRETMNQDLAG